MAYDFTGIPSIIEIGGVRANSWGRYWSWIQRWRMQFSRCPRPSK